MRAATSRRGRWISVGGGLLGALLLWTCETRGQDQAPLAWAGLQGAWLGLDHSWRQPEGTYAAGDAILLATWKGGSGDPDWPDWWVCGSPIVGDTCPGPEVDPDSLYGQSAVIKRLLGDAHWEIGLDDGRSPFLKSRSGPTPMRPLPKAFLLAARSQWIGKSFFYSIGQPNLFSTFTRFTRWSSWAIHPTDGVVEVAHLERFVVRDVVMGDRGPYPLSVVYFVLQPEQATGGEVALLASGGLFPGALAFTPDDLRQFAQWPLAMQATVREHRVLIGMTPAQAVMSLGVPQRRDRVTDEKGVTQEWCYPGKRLSFAGGRLIRVRESTGHVEPCRRS